MDLSMVSSVGVILLSSVAEKRGDRGEDIGGARIG